MELQSYLVIIRFLLTEEAKVGVIAGFLDTHTENRSIVDIANVVLAQWHKVFIAEVVQLLDLFAQNCDKALFLAEIVLSNEKLQGLTSLVLSYFMENLVQFSFLSELNRAGSRF